MPRWSTALSQAGITDRSLRHAYGVQRRLVRRYRREEYWAVRLLLPGRMHPHMVAAVAFMHETDRRIDQGHVRVRHDALRSWDREVKEALANGADAQGDTLRALVHTAQHHPQVAACVHDFLDGAPVEAAWNGFEDEADFQDYVERYSMPALMLTMSLIGPPPGERHELFVRGCRFLIHAMQRTDFLADLPEDLQHGRVGIPNDALKSQGLDVQGLRERPQEAAAALGRLVDAQAALADRAFWECRRLPTLVDLEYRPFLKTLISVQEARLRAVERSSGSILQGGAGPSMASVLSIFWREYRAARSEPG